MATNNLNWQRSYLIEFGIPEIVTEAYNIEGVFTDPAEGVVDATTVPSDARRISNLVEDDAPLRGFNFTLDTKRSNGKSATSSERTTLEIYNLSPEMLALFNDPACVCNVSAGYGGKVDLVYAGGVVSVNRRASGDDIIYRISLKEVSVAATDTKVSLTYPESETVSNVIKDLISKFPSTTTGTVSTAQYDNVTVTGGICVQGKLVPSLERMFQRFGLDYSIENGKINVRPTQVVQGDPDYNILVNNTYVLTPEVVKSLDPVIQNKGKENKRKDNKRSVILTTFLIPIKLDQFFTIPPDISEELAGTYKIKTIQNKIGSRGTTYDTIIAGEPM